MNLSLQSLSGFDHGAGHPFLLLCDTKAPNLRNNKAFKGLGHYFKWLKVANAVIKARFRFIVSSLFVTLLGQNVNT